MKEIEFFKLDNGKKPVQEWLDSLDKSVKSKIIIRIERLANSYGNYKKIDNTLFELKFKIGPGYRIYFTEIKDIVVILLNAGDKSTQTKDIKKAKEYISLLKRRTCQ